MDPTTSDGLEFSIGDAEDALEALSRHSGDCVKVIDLDGRIVRWNGACEELYGWSAKEVIGRTLPHIPSELRLRALSDIRRVSAGGQVVERDGEAQRADGTRVVMRMTLIPVLDSDGHAAGIVTTAREMAGDRRMERQRDEFLAFVSRRLSSPLAAIQGSAQLLNRPEILADGERREATLSAITQQAKEVSMLLEDVLVISEISEGRLVLEMSSVDLGELVSEVSMAGGLASRGYVEFDPTMPQVKADRRRLSQAISALIENAVQRATSPDAVSVSVFLSGDDAVIDVADDGPSPTVSERDRLFEQFSDPEAASVPSLADAMGLYLARYVAEAHGGGVHLSVPKDGGATYSLFVPVNSL